MIFQTRIIYMAYIIYGTGIFSDVLLDEILMDDEQVLAFCLDDNLIDADTHLDRPLLSFSNVEEFYPPTDVDLLIGITYQKKNETRNAYYQKGIDKGYSMSGFVSKNSNISKKTTIGKNNIILSGNLIQAGVEIGQNNVLWNTNHIGHHSKIGDNCFISSHVVISGNCEIGKNAFFGVNSTVIDNITIGDYSLIGAGAVVKEDTMQNQVIK